MTKGGGGQAIWAMPVWKQHISKRGFPNLSHKRKEGKLDQVGSNVHYKVMKLCTGSVKDRNGWYLVVLSQFDAVPVGD